jgi:hypothetical protein
VCKFTDEETCIRAEPVCWWSENAEPKIPPPHDCLVEIYYYCCQPQTESQCLIFNYLFDLCDELTPPEPIFARFQISAYILIIRFTKSVYTLGFGSGAGSCSGLFTEEGVLGQNPCCEWNDDSTEVKITLGSDATMRIGQVL